MPDRREIEFVFEPQDEGGYYVYAPDLPGLHTQGEDLEDATESAREALALYVEGLREDGRSVETGVVRRALAIPARPRACRSFRRAADQGARAGAGCASGRLAGTCAA
ncbi:MAG TPA: type II toxin-antitoxin system HicB family antitoxin [Solirubrobacteraceae bacterium]